MMKNFIMRPFKAIKDKFTAIKDKIKDKFGGLISKLKGEDTVAVNSENKPVKAKWPVKMVKALNKHTDLLESISANTAELVHFQLKAVKYNKSMMTR